MIIQSQIIETLEQGVVLDVTIEELVFKVYAIISEPDIERVADFVPAEQFEQAGDVHVTSVGLPEEAEQQFEDLAFNMNIGDALVFLCQDGACLEALLLALGQTIDDTDA
jgi:hypothetical protein